jgi:dihydrofolate synthase/folylpolyglutamate synthase
MENRARTQQYTQHSISAPGWTYSPVPDVESAVQEIRRKYPATYPEGIERVHALLEKLGNPHRQLPFIFHVAGTNGKGSTLAFLQAVFEAGGLAVHKYTSPHLVRFEERIVLAGKMIGPEPLLALIKECDRAAAGSPVSFFEFFTVLAFLASARQPAAAVLLETGLGGAYDATNVVGGDRLVSLLTCISYDHVHVLGSTLPEIARHKAGIIKPGRPCIIAPQTSPEVLEVFSRQAAAAAAPVYAHGRDWEIAFTADGFEYRGASGRFHLPLPQLVGRHQVDNAGTALAALEKSPYAGLLQQKILERAMQNVSWPGRLQRVAEGPLAELLPEGWELWLDGAHNDSGAEMLAAQAKDWGSPLPLHLVTAMKRTKDARGFYQHLLPYAATVQAVETGMIEAPMTEAEALKEHIRQMGYERVTVAGDLGSALRSLVSQYRSPQRILITGSLYLVGHALKEQSYQYG